MTQASPRTPFGAGSGRPLPHSTPTAQGVDPGGIAISALEAAPDIEPHSLMVLRHGFVVAEGWWAPYSRDGRHLLYSVSKSFTATALGLAVAEGLVGLDDLIIDHFPELPTSPAAQGMRIRHLAAMASGHGYDTWTAAREADPDEPVRGFLRLPPDRQPGSVFAYNQSATYTIAAIVQRAVGLTLVDYLRPRLFDPLGIGDVAWTEHPAGRNLGFSGMFATTDAVARLGQLYLQRGEWNGRRLLSEEWVAAATTLQVSNGGGENPDWSQGYGYQFWISRHGYRGDGAFGQFCVVLPEEDAVIATTAASSDMQKMLDLAWAHLLPAFGEVARADRDAEAALDRRLASLVLRPVPQGSDGREDWIPGHFRPAADSEEPVVVAVEVVRDLAGWRVALSEDEWRLELQPRTGGWSAQVAEGPSGEAVPVAASGGWSGPGALRFDVAFLETPHRLSIECDIAHRTFRARWLTTPLTPPESLVELRATASPR